MTTAEKPTKPLGRKSYGSIGHMPGSRTGPGDWTVPDGQLRIATERARDRTDHVIVTEKVDGSCVAIARIGDEIVPLGRAGYRAETSPYAMHHAFAMWASENRTRLLAALEPGERMIGEWLAVAHGTIYAVRGEPFIPFDVMKDDRRLLHDEARERMTAAGLAGAAVLHVGAPLALDLALAKLGEHGHHGALEPAEGVVYRVEHAGRGREVECDFLMKYVHPGKVDGKYLSNLTGGHDIWLWRPLGWAS